MAKISPWIFILRRKKMPYKDPEKRRTYQRDYKRRQRSQAKLSNPGCQTLSNPAKTLLSPSQTQKRKVYICQRLPSYRFSSAIQFKNGLFVTDQPEEQRIIESDPVYGKEIFSCTVEP
jgi:hypothetical protein